MHPLIDLLGQRKSNNSIGIYSACTANRLVIETVLERAQQTNTLALVEATANQVNQFGGYTGMTPADFRDFLFGIADGVGFDRKNLILGGDHLGPLTWQNDDEQSAMEKACELVRQYVMAGFTKIHLDTSMRLSGDDPGSRLSDETIASRAAQLAKACESAFYLYKQDNPDALPPVYVIGSEVPIPGGAQAQEETITVTRPRQMMDTYCAFQLAFSNASIGDAFQRVIAIVVQPGVEFSDNTVHSYCRESAKDLTHALEALPNMVFEGHSTDYQTPQHLKEMVQDGISILKVGPALTFALREALFLLEEMEQYLFSEGDDNLSRFRDTLERAMLTEPKNWVKHYHGTEQELAFKRKFSFSDRCRYYLPTPDVERAVGILLENIDRMGIPMSLLSQYMPNQYRRIRDGKLPLVARSMVKDRIRDMIDDYIFATK